MTHQQKEEDAYLSSLMGALVIQHGGQVEIDVSDVEKVLEMTDVVILVDLIDEKFVITIGDNNE